MSAPFAKPVIRKSILLSLILFIQIIAFAQPKITSFSPSVATVGSPVTLTGTGFSSTAANNIVYFGAVKASVTNASANSLTVTVPAGATYEPISVTTGGLTGYSSGYFSTKFEAGNFRQKIVFDRPLSAYLRNGLVADFDGDGKTDLLISKYTSGESPTISVLKNNSTDSVSFLPELIIGTGASNAGTYLIDIADIDGDGKKDIITSNSINLQVWRNTSTNTISFQQPTTITSMKSYESFVVADFDADGKADIITSTNEGYNTSFTFYRNNSNNNTVSFAAGNTFFNTVALSSFTILAADFDGDGKADLTARSSIQPTLLIFRNISSAGNIGFTAPSNTTLGLTSSQTLLGDFNNDGKKDIAVTYTFDDQLTVLENTSSSGSITFLEPKNIGTTNSSPFIKAGDVNGDGYADIYNISRLFQNDGYQSLSSFTTMGAFAYGSIPAAIADFDNDNKPDIFFLNDNNAQIYRNKTLEPYIEKIDPVFGAEGDTITISGYEFSQATSVSFGKTSAASFFVQDNSTIKAIIGKGDSGRVQVTSAKGKDVIDGFIFGYRPVINSITPISARAGTPIVVKGNYFTQISSVTFANKAPASFTVTSDTTITIIADTGTISGPITITNKFGNTSKAGFVYIPKPVILSFNAPRDSAGATIFIQGYEFINISKVRFGNTDAASFNVISPYLISATVANGSTGNVTLITPYDTVNKAGFTFIPAPIIHSFTSQAEKYGTVLIVGQYFDTAISVSIGGMPADTFTVVSSDTIKASVGLGGSGTVSVYTHGGRATASGFTLLSTPINAPVISSFSPLEAKAGDIITIAGSNFGSSALQNIVMVGNVKAEIVTASSTQIQCKVPLGAISSNLSVSSNNFMASSSKKLRIVFDGTGEPFTTNMFKASAVAAFEEEGYGWPSLATGDLDGDGKTDLIACRNNEGEIIIFKNSSQTGKINLTEKLRLPFQNSRNQYESVSLIVKDLNGDNKPDIVIASDDWVSTVSVFINNSNSENFSFTLHSTIKLLYGGKLAIADMNNDGRPDIVRGTPYLTIIKNTTRNNVLSFGEPVIFPQYGSTNADVFDFDNDGKNDVVLQGYGDENGTEIVHNSSTLDDFSFDHSFKVGPDVQMMSSKIAMADLNKDGKEDLFYRSSNYGSGVILINTSTPGNISFIESTVASGLWLDPGYTAGDLDGDGLSDLVLTSTFVKNNSSSQSISLGTETYFPFLFPSLSVASTIEDLDMDGKPDVIQGGTGQYRIQIQRNALGEAADLLLCPNGSTTITATQTGNNYQWQISTDSGRTFTNIAANSNYANENTASLKLNNLPSSFYGYQYRCMVNGNNAGLYRLTFANNWTGNSDNNWNNAANWSCGSVPDANTDVTISSGTILVNANAHCRSISISPQATVTVQSGFNLTVSH